MTDVQLWRHRYNTVMKLIFISSSLAICYYMRVHKVVRQTYDRNEDTFREWFLVAPCALLAVLLPQQRTPVEVRLLPAPFRHHNTKRAKYAHRAGDYLHAAASVAHPDESCRDT
jgi:ER lumen protein retaining receptor